MKKIISVFLITLLSFLSACEKSADTNADGRQEIVLALAEMSIDPSVEAQIALFNKSNPDYYITVDNYYEGDNIIQNINDSAELAAKLSALKDAQQLLDIAISTQVTNRKSPDIIITNPASYKKYITRNILADLTGHYQRDISPADIFENVHNALLFDQKLYGILPSFYLSGILCMDKSLAPSDMSMETLDMLQKGVDYSIFGAESREANFSAWLTLYMNEFIDPESGSCDFNNPKFIYLLEEAKEYPWELSSYDLFDKAITESQPVFLRTGFHTLYTFQAHSNLFAGNMTCSGYPGQENVWGVSGSIFAIIKNSPHIDGAWEFISSLLSYEYHANEKPSHIPISRTFVEAFLAENAEEKNPEGENEVIGWGYVIERSVEITHLKPEAMEYFLRLLDEKEMRLETYDNTIHTLIMEEVQAYFEGGKSLERVIDHINNRVQLYLDEINYS